MLKELPNHWTIPATQTRSCLEKLLLIIINFDPLAIFHYIFAMCCSTSEFLLPIQHHISTKILTATCWQQELSHYFPPQLRHTNTSAKKPQARRSKQEMSEVSGTALSFHYKGQVSWRAVSVHLCVHEHSSERWSLNDWAVAERAITWMVFFQKLFLEKVLIFFPGKILKFYPCFEVLPCFTAFFSE